MPSSRSMLPLMLTMVMAACASTPPGPTDAEVEAELQSHMGVLTERVVVGSTTEMLELFAEDARMNLQNINGVSRECHRS